MEEGGGKLETLSKLTPLLTDNGGSCVSVTKHDANAQNTRTFKRHAFFRLFFFVLSKV